MSGWNASTATTRLQGKNQGQKPGAKPGAGIRFSRRNLPASKICPLISYIFHIFTLFFLGYTKGSN